MATFELHPGRKVGGDHQCYVIADLGQNHRGELSIAQLMIKKAVDADADCVMLQMSDIDKQFTKAARDQPYPGDRTHSFGETYGWHKKKLTFTREEFRLLQGYAQNQGIHLAATGMDCDTVDFLLSTDIPWLKIGSADLNNYALIERIIKHKNKVPIILSTGMHTMDLIKKTVSMINDSGRSCCILQATNAFPCPNDDINLNVIKTYEKEFPNNVIGFSGHERSDDIAIAAVARGARVLEKRLTFDRDSAGSSNSWSYELDEFIALVEKIRTVECAFGSYEKRRLKSEEPCFRKLSKSLVAARDLAVGDIIDESLMEVKVSEPPGIAAHYYYSIIGKKVAKAVSADMPIQFEDLAMVQ